MSGKWDEPTIPKHDWSCVGFTDLGSVYDGRLLSRQICEMCEARAIRYVHHMRHPDYATDLNCGCVCAANMEKDAAAAPARERHARNLELRRNRWLKRKWKVNGKRDEYTYADGCCIFVFAVGAVWKASITDQLNGNMRESKRFYPSADAAKLAAFDVLPLLRKLWSKGT